MTKKIQVMMTLIRDELQEITPDAKQFLALSDQEQQDIAALAGEHSVAQLLGDALGNAPEAAELEVTKKLVRNTMSAFTHIRMIERERNRICRVLNEVQIPYIGLKGIRVRPYYPKPWMRTSCDNDILVREEDVDRAAELLIRALDYRQEGRKGFHDISLFSKSGIHLELHFNIRGRSDAMNRVLDRVWEDASPVPGTSEYVQSQEFFLFHIVAHMANHMLCGGCGIRPLIDLFLLREKMDYDEEKLLRLCDEAGIRAFYQNAVALSQVWFAGKPHTPVTGHLEQYIFRGGCYGTQEGEIAVTQNRTGKKFDYVASRVFLPYENMCTIYPVLKKRRWLLPVYQLRRWGRALKAGKLQFVRQSINAAQNVDEGYSLDVRQMLEENELL